MGDDPGSDDEKSISWDDSKCMGLSSWTPTSQTWLFKQEQEKKKVEVKKAEKISEEDKTENLRRGDNEKNAKKTEAGFACQEEPRRLERESEEAEEESKSRESEWMQPNEIDNWSNQGMFGIIGEASQVWEEARLREKKKREEEKKARNKIEEERAKFSKLLKREKEEKERKIKKADEDKERAKQPDHKVSQSRFYHPTNVSYFRKNRPHLVQ